MNLFVVKRIMNAILKKMKKIVVVMIVEWTNNSE